MPVLAPELEHDVRATGVAVFLDRGDAVLGRAGDRLALVQDLVGDGRLAAKGQVSDTLLDRCKPIAGTPEDCVAAIEEYREAGCTHVMLELWGADRHEQIRLFGEKVLPEFR